MFSNPAENLASLDLRPGMVVIDVGTGSGFYAIEAARLVGPSGKVFAVDVQEDLLSRLKNEAHRLGLHNIEVIHSNAEKEGGMHIRNNAADAVIVSNVLFQADDKVALAKEVARVTKQNGKVLLVDWSDISSVGGPSQENIVSKEVAEACFLKAGMVLLKEVDAGDHHYGLVLIKKNEKS
jgi:ubiquinone/menaquinone biosynthesis C-methylase UbiE